jgi:hypothetical protein
LVSKTPSTIISSNPDPNQYEIVQPFWGKVYDNASDFFQKGANYLERLWEKTFDKHESDLKKVEPIQIEGDYKLRNNYSTTGDTIAIANDPRRYFIPENLHLNQFTFEGRSRGNYTPISSEGAPITLFNPIKPYEQIDNGKSGQAYIGIDKNGNFKAGDYSIFGPGDRMTRTYVNNIIGFKKDSDGKTSYKMSKNNGTRSIPIVYV